MASPHVAIIGTRGYPSFYGGFETAVRELAPYLVDHGWRVTVYGREANLATDRSAFDPRVESVVTRGFDKKSASTLSYGLTACLHARRLRPDVALVMNVANGYWLPILRSAGIPTLVNTDGIEWDRAKWGRLAKKVFHTGARATARYADDLVFDAREIERRWETEFGRSGNFIPYGGSPFPDQPVEPGLTHRGYVLIVARFVPENTVREFFAAVPALADSHDVVIVGSSGFGGELDEHAQRLAEEHSRVQWLGHVSDDRRLFALWQHAGAYFHGHSVGGTNPALVQAMALGVPVVARDTVYNREVLSDGALFVQPDPDSIVTGLRTMLEDEELQRTSVEHASLRASQIYSWPLVNQAYAEALGRVLGRRTSAAPTSAPADHP